MMAGEQPNDWARHARHLMIRDQIAARGIKDPRVLEAMAAVPREYFVPSEERDRAYEDRALAIAEHQTISQPYIVAIMTEALGVGPHDKTLEVGTGSGYQAAILARLTDCLHTIERLESLAEAAEQRLSALGITGVQFHYGDGSLGWPEAAPYDRIIVTAAAPSVPPALVEQLAEGGVLVIPLGGPSQQTLTVLNKQGGRTVERTLIACRFVKLVGRDAW